MRRAIPVLAILFALGLIMPNWGPMLDMLSYRTPVAQARAMLPEGWQGLTGATPEDRIARLIAAQSPTQRAAMEAASARFIAGAEGVILAIPRGFETEELRLSDGCFRFARRALRIFVWHFDTPIGCI